MRDPVDTESAFQDALKVLQNIRPSDRVVLSQILDLVADVAQFQIEKDSEAPLRLGKIFGPVLLRGESESRNDREDDHYVDTES